MADKKLQDLSFLMDTILVGCATGLRAASPVLEQGKAQFLVLKEKAAPVMEKLTEQSSALLTLVGLALVFHGHHFAKFLICVQAVRFVGGTKGVTEAARGLYNDLTTEKKEEDKDAATEDKAETEEAKNKHAAKREAAKSSTAKPSAADQANDLAAGRKLLKSIDGNKVFSLFGSLCASFLCCFAALNSSLGLAFVLAPSLADQVLEQLVLKVSFSSYEDMKRSVNLILRTALILVWGVLVCLMPSLALAVSRAEMGAVLVLTNGAAVAEKLGKLKDTKAEDFVAGDTGKIIIAGLLVVGTLWQLWASVSDSGFAWYMSWLYLVYFPGYILESIPAMFAA